MKKIGTCEFCIRLVEKRLVDSGFLRSKFQEFLIIIMNSQIFREHFTNRFSAGSVFAADCYNDFLIHCFLLNFRSNRFSRRYLHISEPFYSPRYALRIASS